MTRAERSRPGRPGGVILLLCLLLMAAASAAAQNVPDQALHQAARTNDVELATFALKRGAALEGRDPLGNTPLQVSAMHGSPAVAELLLQRGADPAAATPDDAWTALHYAAYEGHDRVAALLIAGGAPLEAREADYGNTPLHLAARRLKRPVVAALLAGDVDVIEGVPTSDIQRLKKDPNVALSSGISNRVIYLHLDHDRDDSPYVKAVDGGAIKNPLKLLKVRQAISKAINRKAIVERVMEGVAIPAGQLLPEGFFGVSPDLKPEPYDLAGAKKLLKEAGHEKGFQLTLHGPNDRYINDAKIAEAIGQMLTRLGLKMKVETMTRSVFFKDASRGGPDNTPKFSFILVGWGAGTGESSSPLKSLLATYDKTRGFGASNRGRYSNPEMDKLLIKALATVDDEKRAELLAKATETAIKDLGIIPLHYQVNTWGTKKGLSYEPRTDERTVAMMVK